MQLRSNYCTTAPRFMELLYTGRCMDVHEAARWGLVNAVLDDEDALMEKVGTPSCLCSQPLVFAAIKELAREASAMTFQEGMNWITKKQFATVDALYSSEDNMEGFKDSPRSARPSGKGASASSPCPSNTLSSTASDGLRAGCRS